ncbi:MAG: SprT family zinc-dependent metalloprotease [Thermaerobacter sp.]|nr:SprT family zinc-dependent metalloprotease [Thermaerobacter sp.]
MPTFAIGSTVIPYTIEERPRRQHPAIRIDANRQVTVLVPRGFDPDHVKELLQRKSRWLVKHWTTPPLLAAPSAKQFVNGESFWLKGDRLRLQVIGAEQADRRLAVSERTLMVTIPLPAPAGAPILIRETIIKWYREEALTLFSARIHHYAPLVGAGATRLKIAEYKSRWGFCREDGLIALNWRVIQAPLSVIDYVIVHELTHRRHPHHRPAFWDAVGRVLPEFLAEKQWLRQHGAELGW